MNGKTLKNTLQGAVLLLIGCILIAAPSFGAEYNLTAGPVPAPGLTMPGGAAIPAWGFACTSAVAPAVCPPGSGTPSVPGPVLTIPPGDTSLIINLTNNLAVPTSIVIPSLPAASAPVDFLDTAVPPRSRIRSFVAETAPGTTSTYSWTSLRPGTFLYKSGTHPTLQPHMGLYGAVKKDAAAGQAYPGVNYDADLVLIYSEIDAALHATATPANALNFKPTWYLINGKPYSAAAAPLNAGGLNQKILLRFVNAGLIDYIPTVLGPNWTVIAEDGHPYLYKKDQYSVQVAAGQSRDVLWNPKSEGTYAVYERGHHLTNGGAFGGGMIVKLAVGAAAADPNAVADAYTASEDTPLTATVAGPPAGVLANDTGTAPLTAELVSGTSSGGLNLLADGSFTYTPNANFAGTDEFTYRARNGSGVYSSVAKAAITVSGANDAPTAANDAYNANVGVLLSVPAPGVLSNDTDVDLNPITAVLVSGIPGLSLNANGSFTYTGAAAGPVSFTYRASDGTLTSAITTVTITVAPNQPPVAVNDFARAKIRTVANTPTYVPNPISVLLNDSDPEGALNPASVILPTSLKTSRGGVVSVNASGIVSYTPPLNFLGTDTFKYSVRDTAGIESNKATVTINITR